MNFVRMFSKVCRPLQWFRCPCCKLIHIRVIRAERSNPGNQNRGDGAWKGDSE